MERLAVGSDQLMASAPPPPPGFLPDDAPPPPRRGMFAGKTPRPSYLFPTGVVHDGDTFRLNTGQNGRLFGVDAFELKQQGMQRGQLVPLGEQSRDALIPYLRPDASVTPTGSLTYGRPVVSLSNDGQDAGKGMLDQGMGVATPQYLQGDPRLETYMEAERLARLNRRGAHAGEFQNPADFRKGKPDPWARPEWQDAPTPGSVAVFNDEPTPFQGLRPEVAAGYQKIWTDPASTADNLLAYAKANGFIIDADTTRKAYAERAKRGADPTVRYAEPPKLLTNPGDGIVGAAARGLADPINMLDEMGGVVDTLGLTPGRENIWSSDRRFADVLYNNIDQNRSILDYDDAEHPYARFGGQLASGLALPGASVEGVGLAAARQVLREGGTRFAAEQAAKQAVRRSSAIAGSVEGGLAGFGQGEGGIVDRLPGAGIGAIAGGGLGYGAAALAQEVAPLARQMIGRAGEDSSRRATMGALDATDSPAVNGALDENAPPRGFVIDEPAGISSMANETDNPAIRARLPDHIDVMGSRPAPLDQGMSEAQLSASSEQMEPRDILPLSRGADAEPAASPDDTTDFAGNIRLDKLETPQDIQRALTVTDARVGGFDAARRGIISQEETQRLANDLGMTPETLLSRRKGQAFNAEEALAARQLLAKSGNELVNLARRVQGMEHPGEEALAAFRRAWLRHVAIQEQVSGATAEAGRALAQFRIAANSRDVPGNVLNGLVEGAGGVDRLKDAARIIVDGSADPATLNKIAARAMKPRFADKLVELWYNSLLSGPQTHVVNMVSNTMTSLGQLPEHALAAGIGGMRNLASRQAVNDRVLFTELGARSVGLLQGLKEGLVEGVRTMRRGSSSDMVSKVEGDAQHAISGIKGSIIRTPTRALAAEDEIFKAMARRMELSGLAVRQTKAEGLKGKAAQARVADLIANPTDDMLEKAFDYGRYLTFQRPLGPVMRHVSALTQTAPVLKLVLPFVKTPTNLLKFTLERSPAAPVLKEWRAEVKAGGARRDLALARAAVGSAFGALAMEWANQGVITGGGPADDGAKDLMRADGWQPYSVKIGDRYYSYQRLDPLAMTLGIAADMVAMQEYMTDKQREQVAFLLTTATLKNMSEKTWFSGVSDLALAVSDPQRYGASLVRKTVSSMAVPAGVAQVARTVDPTLREAETIMEAVRARMPIASRSLEPRRDVWGQPITNEGGLGPDIMSPVWTSTRRNDPVNSALLDAGAHVGRPSREVGGQRLSLPEYGRYQETAGMLGYQQLNGLVGSPDWSLLSRDDKQDTVAKIVRDARKEARGMLFNDSPPPPAGFAIDPPPAGFVMDQ